MVSSWPLAPSRSPSNPPSGIMHGSSHILLWAWLACATGNHLENLKPSSRLPTNQFSFLVLHRAIPASPRAHHPPYSPLQSLQQPSTVQGASEAVNGSRALPSFFLLVEFASNVRCSFRLLPTWCFAQRPNNDDGIAEYRLFHSADGLHKSEILHLNCAHQLRTCPDVTCLRTGCD